MSATATEHPLQQRHDEAAGQLTALRGSLGEEHPDTLAAALDLAEISYARG
jgi:hypothetical protein